MDKENAKPREMLLLLILKAEAHKTLSSKTLPSKTNKPVDTKQKHVIHKNAVMDTQKARLD